MTEPWDFEGWIWPTSTVSISGYNWLTHPTHWGIDIGTGLGRPVWAVADATILFAGWDTSGYGNLVIIETKSRHKIYYAHLSELWVKQGQKVSQNQTLGLSGSTGNSSGPHLHFEIRGPGNTRINPWDVYGKNPQPGKPVPGKPPGTTVPIGTNPQAPGTAPDDEDPTGLQIFLRELFRALFPEGLSINIPDVKSYVERGFFLVCGLGFIFIGISGLARDQSIRSAVKTAAAEFSGGKE